ncbi:MAG TPA: hypothetical protein ENH82_11240 [bacterium]|nr:hypothetical protein [bacterium]
MAVFLADTSYSLPSEKKLAEQRLAALISADQLFSGMDSYYDRLNKGAEEVYKIEKKYENELSLMAQRARNWSIFSPAVVYETIISRYSCTGIDDNERFLDLMYRYWDKNIRFIRNKAFNFGKNEYLYYKKRMNLPVYKYYPETFCESFTATADYLIILFMLNVLFFLLSYTFFLRKDVR